MDPDLLSLYRLMLFSRLYESSVSRLWQEGRISGEMHLGVGEEAIAAGIISQLLDGDALALDHRGTPELLMRGVDPVALLREFLGRSDGLCGGMGGHMHLFAPEKMAATSGIVGSGGPAAAGFALAAKRLRPGTAAVAFFGEGAMNQGMLMESMNLAAVWKLPVVFVCKDSQWSITTRSSDVTGGSLLERASGLGLTPQEVNGTDVMEVWHAANISLSAARMGKGPGFLLAHCHHLEGHFLGDPLLEMGRAPLKSMQKRGASILKALTGKQGLPFTRRLSALLSINTASTAIKNQAERDKDPIWLTRRKLAISEENLMKLEDELRGTVREILKLALNEAEVEL